MARLSFRTPKTNTRPARASVSRIVLTLVAAIAASQLSGCTAPVAPPQAPPPIAVQPVAPPPAPPPPVEAPIAPPPAEEAAGAGRLKVALLAPLTGPNKTVGQAMLDAADMALFEVSGDIALLPRDTGSSQDNTQAAADKAIADGARLILGPVFSTSVPAVRDTAGAAGINVITYSTDATVAGGNTFVMGFLPAGQVERAIAFAKSRGMSKLTALIPDNSYGVAVSGEIAGIQQRLGLQSPRIVTLNHDPKAQIAALGDDPPEMLLVALGGEQLQNLAGAIGDYAAQHPVQLLGTGLWADDPALGQIPALVGGWYASPIPGNFRDFAARFQAIYGYKPPRIASLAYDSVALAATIAKASGNNPDAFTKDVLTAPNGFTGIDGGFRFLATGLSERNLAVLAVGPNGPTVVDPPPPSFEKLGE
jgi:ABC-type branched-subunit amino acid transport system substrate-binding protein